jgi:8-oxo-dGTP diphosphatase
MTDERPTKTLRVVGAVFTREHPDTGKPEVLAFRRAPHKDAAGLWEFAGGKIEPGETPEQALTREIEEELGVEVTVDEHLHTSEVWVADRSRHVTLSCFFVTALGAMPTESTDHDEMRWMPISQLHTLTWIAPDVPVVEALQARLQ